MRRVSYPAVAMQSAVESTVGLTMLRFALQITDTTTETLEVLDTDKDGIVTVTELQSLYNQSWVAQGSRALDDTTADDNLDEL